MSLKPRRTTSPNPGSESEAIRRQLLWRGQRAWATWLAKLPGELEITIAPIQTHPKTDRPIYYTAQSLIRVSMQFINRLNRRKLGRTYPKMFRKQLVGVIIVQQNAFGRTARGDPHAHLRSGH